MTIQSDLFRCPDYNQITLEDGRVTTIAAIIHEARVARGHQFREWVRSAVTVVRESTVALLAPAFGLTRHARP